MKIGDLVKSTLMSGEYGIIIGKINYHQPINGFIAETRLYTVYWSSGLKLSGFRLWELEAVDGNW